MGALYYMVAGWLEGSIGFAGEEGRRRAEEAEDGVWMRRERKTIVPGLNSPSATWFHPVETLELMGGWRLVAPHEIVYTSVAMGNGLPRFCATVVGQGGRAHARVCAIMGQGDTPAPGSLRVPPVHSCRSPLVCPSC